MCNRSFLQVDGVEDKWVDLDTVAISNMAKCFLNPRGFEHVFHRAVQSGTENICS